MKRRDLIKYLSVAPLAGAAAGTGVPFQSLAAPAARKVQRDLIKELGLRTFINAAGTYTSHTASIMHDEVMEAINSASKQFVMISDVQNAVGTKIAALCRAEAAMVTAGCFSADMLGAAAALTRTDRAKAGRLPDVSGFDKNEVVVQKGHEYVNALVKTGIIPVYVETAEELEKAVGPKTALMFFCNCNAPQSKIQHKEWLEVAKKHNIPTLIDIAADVPPVTNLWKFQEMGFDMVAISGGKGLCGPQSAGILMGKKEMIDAARLNGFPSGGFGRGMKVNKEEMLGMYAAIERYVNLDHDKEWKMWEDQIGVIENAFTKYKGVTTKIDVPEVANHTPLLKVFFDPALVKITTRDFITKLREGSPSIETTPGIRDSPLSFTVFMLKPGEEKIVASRIREELSKVATVA
jgi:L-seryl-tRNA(Ser) seleniumtransferase